MGKLQEKAKSLPRIQMEYGGAIVIEIKDRGEKLGEILVTVDEVVQIFYPDKPSKTIVKLDQRPI